jgi:hypothetical protein
MHATCPSCPLLHHSNNVWWGLQAMKVLAIQFSSASYYFNPVWIKYSPQNPVLMYLQSVFSCFIRVKFSHPYKIRVKIFMIRQQIRRQKVLNWMVVSTAFNLVMNANSICNYDSKIFELCHIFKGSMKFFKLWFYPAFWWQDKNTFFLLF